jgi:DNA-binding transcriptional MerR regulator
MTSQQAPSLRQIGEVAERVGLSLRTVRYYEEAGLVRPSERTEGGFRLYGPREIARLELIKQMKPLGLTLEEMRELLDARDALDTTEAGTEEYERALDTLTAFADAAKAKTTSLFQELQKADRFAVDLRRELRRYRRRAQASRS